MLLPHEIWSNNSEFLETTAQICSRYFIQNQQKRNVRKILNLQYFSHGLSPLPNHRLARKTSSRFPFRSDCFHNETFNAEKNLGEDEEISSVVNQKSYRLHHYQKKRVFILNNIASCTAKHLRQFPACCFSLITFPPSALSFDKYLFREMNANERWENSLVECRVG
jgi:hypothetical protein